MTRFDVCLICNSECNPNALCTLCNVCGRYITYADVLACDFNINTLKTHIARLHEQVTVIPHAPIPTPSLSNTYVCSEFVEA